MIVVVVVVVLFVVAVVVKWQWWRRRCHWWWWCSSSSSSSSTVTEPEMQNPGRQIAWVNQFCAVASNIYWFSAWNLLHITCLAPII